MPDRIKKAIKKLIAPVYHSITDLIVVNDLRRDITPDPGDHTHFPIRRITASDLERIGNEIGHITQMRFSARLDASQGYFAQDAGNILGWIWVTRKTRPKEGAPPFLYRITPPRTAAYIYDVYTVPTARNQGVMKALLRHLLVELKQNGIEWVFMTHDQGNRAMQQLARNNGFSIAGRLFYRRFLWRHKQDTTDMEKICASN